METRTGLEGRVRGGEEEEGRRIKPYLPGSPLTIDIILAYL